MHGEIPDAAKWERFYRAAEVIDKQFLDAGFDFDFAWQSMLLYAYARCRSGGYSHAHLVSAINAAGVSFSLPTAGNALDEAEKGPDHGKH